MIKEQQQRRRIAIEKKMGQQKKKLRKKRDQYCYFNVMGLATNLCLILKFNTLPISHNFVSYTLLYTFYNRSISIKREAKTLIPVQLCCQLSEKLLANKIAANQHIFVFIYILVILELISFLQYLFIILGFQHISTFQFVYHMEVYI